MLNKKMDRKERYRVPVDVKGSAQRALMWKRNGKKGGTAAGIARAKQLFEDESVGVDTLIAMRSFFARHGPDARGGGTSYPGYRAFVSTGQIGPGAVAWELWGGDAAYLWLKRERDSLRAARPDLKQADDEVRIVVDSTAVCNVSMNFVDGKITLRRKGVHTEARCQISGLSPGLHGLHVHESGDTSRGCGGTCSHYNPDGRSHGGAQGSDRHRGDFGNVEADENGVCKQTILADVALHELLGRAFVVHAQQDDLGKGLPRAESRKTGNAGARLACGAILV